MTIAVDLDVKPQTKQIKTEKLLTRSSEWLKSFPLMPVIATMTSLPKPYVRLN